MQRICILVLSAILSSCTGLNVLTNDAPKTNTPTPLHIAPNYGAEFERFTSPTWVKLRAGLWRKRIESTIGIIVQIEVKGNQVKFIVFTQCLRNNQVGLFTWRLGAPHGVFSDCYNHVSKSIEPLWWEMLIGPLPDEIRELVDEIRSRPPSGLET